MEIVKIVQVGDIHYPDPENIQASIDDKDPGFPSRVKREVGTPPLQAVFRSFASVLEREDPDIIAMMGDFTTRGDEGELRKCLNHLRDLIPDAWSSKVPSNVLLLFGNHDIDRRIDAGDASRWSRVNDAIAAAGFTPAAVDQPQRIDWTGSAGGKVALFGINTCVGCGETRRLSPLIAADVVARIKATLSDPAASDADLDEVVEGIDTPALSEGALSRLFDELHQSGPHVAAIVCGHHNLLPQDTARLAPYAELVNAGSVRASLLRLDRPVIFLHGHLHTDPIEVVRSPLHPRSGIVSIAAPILRDGFNVIEVAFRGATALGCRIVFYRRSGSQVSRTVTQTVPLWTTSEGLKVATKDARQLMVEMKAGHALYRSELLEQAGWDEARLDDAIQELWWLGVVDVLNEESPKAVWRVMRAI